MLVPLLERAAMEAGGEGPPLLLGPVGKPLTLMLTLEPPEFGGEARFGRDGKGPSSAGWYLETDHSLPPTEIGDNGPLRPRLMLMMWK